MYVIAPLLRLMGLCALTFTLVITAQRMILYDDGGLQAAFFSAECAPPCFMGIRPGTTTRGEALALLQKHPWVASVDTQVRYTTVSWAWNGSQPAFLQSGRLSLDKDVVVRIDLLTRANAATAAVVFGAPRVWYFSLWSINNTRSMVTSLYFEQRAVYDNLEVMSANYCPLTLQAQWMLPTQISMPALLDHPGYGSTRRPFPVIPASCR
jgi:hypothetical protein